MKVLDLPHPTRPSAVALEAALLARRSVRSFQDEPLALADLAQMLWSAQGITDADGLRTAPSAGGVYPLTLHIAAGNVHGLRAGVYHYVPYRHALMAVTGGDRRVALGDVALGQAWIADAAVVIAIVADFSRMLEKYGERGIQYVYMEAGAAAQNLGLQAAACGLGTALVGAFDSDAVGHILGLPPHQLSLALLPVGAPTKTQP